MKALCLTVITLLTFIASHAQDTTKTDPAVAGLEKFLLYNIRPVAIAVENNVQGVTVVSFKIDSNKSITDVHVVKSLSREFDAEVLRVFHEYHQSISLPPAEYTVGVWLLLEKRKSKTPMEPFDKSLYQNFLFEINITVGFPGQ